MFRTITVILICLFFVIHASLLAQTQPASYTHQSFTLKGDTLLADNGLQLFAGQKLITGNGSAINGWYQAISFKSLFSAPMWINRDLETKNNPEYQYNPQIRDNDKVREYLTPGDTLVVTKIKREKIRHAGYTYTVFLTNSEWPAINFRSDIATALKTKELWSKEIK